MTTLPLGYAASMTTTSSYAVPTGVILIRSQGTGTLELSNDMVTWAAPTLTNGEVQTSARFARNGGTTGTLVVVCQKVG